MKEDQDTKREQLLRITVDHRERTSAVVPLLHADETVELTEQELDAGDYRIGDRLIERKTASDFQQSIISNRLFRQCRKLRNRSDPGYLLVEGNPYRTGSDMMPEAVRGALISVSVSWCIPVLFSRDPRDTAEMVRTIARQHVRGVQYLNQRSQRGKRNLKSRRIHVLQGLPGIGSAKADRLLDHFGTVRDAMNASRKELLEVEGIGEKITDKICRVLEGTGAVEDAIRHQD